MSVNPLDQFQSIPFHFQPLSGDVLKYLFFGFLCLTASAVAHAQDCSINPGACQPKPIPSECPAGKHWVTIGTGIAHCVTNDPVCTGGTVVHDSIGEPQYCQTSEDRTSSCPAGYSGYKDQTRTVKTALDGSKSYGSWATTYNGCEKDPEPAPAPSSPSTGSGSATEPSTPTTGSGSSGSPTTPSTDNGVTPTPTTTPPQDIGTAPEPHTCSNGASDYPTCSRTPNAVTYTCQTIKEYTYLNECKGSGSQRKYIYYTYRFCRGSDGSTTKDQIGDAQDGQQACSGSGGYTDK